MGQTATKYNVSHADSAYFGMPPPLAAESDNGPREREHDVAPRQRPRDRERERELAVARPAPLPPAPEPQEVLMPTSPEIASTTPSAQQGAADGRPTTPGLARSDSTARRGLGLVRKLSFRSKDRAVTGPLSPGKVDLASPPLPVGAETLASAGRPPKSSAGPTLKHERSIEFALGSGRTASDDEAGPSKPGLLARAASVGHSVARPRPVRARANATPVSVGPVIGGGGATAVSAAPRLATVAASVSSVSGSPSSAAPIATLGGLAPPVARTLSNHSREGSTHRRKTPQGGSPRTRASLTARREREWRAKLASLSLASPPRSPPPSTAGPRPPPRRVQRPSIDQLAAESKETGSSSFHALLTKTVPDPMSSSATFKEKSLKETAPPSPLSTDSPSSEFGFLTPAIRARELGTTFGGNVSPAVSAVGKRGPRSTVSMARSVSTSSAFDRSSVISRVTSRSGAGMPDIDAPPVPRVRKISTRHRDSEMTHSPAPSFNPPPSPAFTLALSLKSPAVPPMPLFPPARGSVVSVATGSSEQTACRDEKEPRDREREKEKEKEREKKDKERKRVSAASSAQASSSTRTHEAAWTPDERVVVSRASVPDMHVYAPPPRDNEVPVHTPRRGTACDATTTSKASPRSQGINLPSAPTVTRDRPTVIPEAPTTIPDAPSSVVDWGYREGSPVDMDRNSDTVMELPPHMTPQLRRQGTTASASTTYSTSTSLSTSFGGDPIPLAVSTTRRQPPKPAFFPSRGAVPVNPDPKPLNYASMSPRMYADELMSPGLHPQPQPPAVPVVPSLPSLGHGQPTGHRKQQVVGVRGAASAPALKHNRPRSREAIAIHGVVCPPAELGAGPRPATQPQTGLAVMANGPNGGPVQSTYALPPTGSPSPASAAPSGLESGHPLRGVDLTPGLASGKRPRKTGLPMADLQRWLAQTSSG